MVVRGLLLDSARCLERREYYRRVIDFAGARGVNLILWHFTDDQGCTLRFDSLPALAGPHAYSKAEMRRLVRYARQRGVAIVPELATLGHCRYITRHAPFRKLEESDEIFSCMCPVADQTRGLVKILIEETAEVFGGEHLHVGLDEVQFGTHPLSRAALATRSRAQIFAEYIQFLHGVVAGCGKRMWMWDDGVLAEPSLAELIPRDIVMCDWQYQPRPPTDGAQRLLDGGFDVILASALISHDQTIFPGEQFALPNIRAMRGNERLSGAGKILGSVVTIWTPVRYLSESMWLPIDLAAAILREGADVDLAGPIKQFGEEFYGLSGQDAARWTVACAELLTLIPRRQQWLAIARGDVPIDGQRPEVQSAQWKRLNKSLRQSLRSATKNRRARRTFLLMVDVLTHCYEAAAMLRRTRASSALARLAARGGRLLARLENVWDRERFADDPKKHTPTLEFFRDDHLLLLMRRGVRRLENAAVSHALSTAAK